MSVVVAAAFDASSRLLQYLSYFPVPWALAKLIGREGGAGAERAILPYVGHLQLISTLKIGAHCCQLCQYKLTIPNLTLPNLTYPCPEE